MKTFSLIVRTSWMVALAWLLTSPTQAKSTQKIPTQNGSGIEIDASCDFDNLPPSGAVPLHITIHNNSTRAGTWSFRTVAINLGTTQSITVESGQTRTVPMLTPMFSEGGSSPYVYFLLNVTGPAVDQTVNFPNNGNTTHVGPATQYLAMSRELTARSWEPLKKKVEGEKRTFSGTQFDAADLGTDWRGFSGVEWLAFSEPEWAKLAPEVRSAIRQWVGHGGHLVVAAQNSEKINWSDFHLEPGSTPNGYGFGDIRAVRWDGKELNPEVLSVLIQTTNSRLERLNRMESKSWPLLKAMGQVKPNKVLILGFVLVFAVLIGPVNLFYFAPSSTRHRLFWTTPLLSLGGSLLLMTVIIFQEGTGGTGSRFALIRLLPDAHEAVVVQEQVSRTSLLLGSKFTLNEDVLAIPMRFDGMQNSNQTGSVIEGRTFSGTWFKSRSIQAQRIASVRSTRAALTVIGFDAGGAPIVISSIESPLETVFLTDKDSKFWRADNVRTGEKATLKPVDRKDRDSWWGSKIKQAGSSMGEVLREGFDNKGSGMFLASVAQPKEELFATLPSIRWKDDHVVYLGPVTQAFSAQTGETQP